MLAFFPRVQAIAGRGPNSPATRPSASPPTSPSFRSCCASHRPLSARFRY